jgi:hypothetical protein
VKNITTFSDINKIRQVSITTFNGTQISKGKKTSTMTKGEVIFTQ